MHTGENGEGEYGAQQGGAGDPDPADRINLQPQDKKDGGHLGEGVGFSEDAGAKVAQADDGEQERADSENADIAAEDEHGELPGNFAHDGEDKEHRAEQELVGYGVEILPEESLLLELAGEQAVESVAEAGKDEKSERPGVVAGDHVNNDERHKHHAQQRELVRRGKDLGKFHGRSPAAAAVG